MLTQWIDRVSPVQRVHSDLLGLWVRMHFGLWGLLVLPGGSLFGLVSLDVFALGGPRKDYFQILKFASQAHRK